MILVTKLDFVQERQRLRAEKLQALLEPVVEGLGYELVWLEVVRAKTVLLRLYIDTPHGINLDDCERVSRQVSGVMDVEDPISGEYTLEVSSPGLDRPLAKPEHFVQFAGYAAKVQLSMPLDGQRNFSGQLLGLENEQVVLVDGDNTWRLPLVDIERARLLPELDIAQAKPSEHAGKKRHKRRDQ